METKIVAKKRITIIISICFTVILMVTFIGLNVSGVFKKSSVKETTKKLEFIEVTESDIQNTKLVSGNISTGNTKQFFLDSSKGVIDKIYVEKGQKVKKGDRILSYSNEELNYQLEQTEIEKRINNNEYTFVTNNIKQLKKEIENEKKNKNEESVHTLEEELRNEVHQQELATLNIEKTNIQIKEIITKQENQIIYSPINGHVQSINSDGTVGTANIPVIGITSDEPLVVEGYLTELQREKVQKNQKVSITAKAIPGETWEGRIVEIDNRPNNSNDFQEGTVTVNTEQSISYYLFKVELDDEKGLVPGYHVAIEIDLSLNKVLAVPRSSIVNENNEAYAYVNKDEKIKKQKVKTGLSDENSIEILEGLNKGDKIVNKPSNSITAGREVKTND